MFTFKFCFKIISCVSEIPESSPILFTQSSGSWLLLLKCVRFYFICNCLLWELLPLQANWITDEFKFYSINLRSYNIQWMSCASIVFTWIFFWLQNGNWNELLKVENRQTIDRSMGGRKDITKIKQVTSKRPYFLVNLLLIQSLLEKGLFLCVCIHKCVPCVCRCLWNLEEGSSFPASEVINRCEPYNMDLGNC